MRDYACGAFFLNVECVVLCMVFLGKKAISSVYSEIMAFISEYSLGKHVLFEIGWFSRFPFSLKTIQRLLPEIFQRTIVQKGVSLY
jgi:hypothetical protein